MGSVHSSKINNHNNVRHPRPASPPLPLLETSSPVDLAFLSTHGYISLPLSSFGTLFASFAPLFPASSAFFAQNADEKSHYARKDGKEQDKPEEGWSCILGEKEMITLRCGRRTPSHLLETSASAWSAGGEFFKLVLAAIARSLGLEQDVFHGLAEGETSLPDGLRKSNTLMRLFRYDRPVAETQEQGRKVVSIQHSDLGLLSLVVGSSPGLECFDPVSQQWIDIESSTSGGTNLTITLLVGRTLSFLTRERFVSGRHRVCVPAVAAGQEESSPYRYSTVLALRPCVTCPLHTLAFEAPRTGVFPLEYQLYGAPAEVLWLAIVRSHWSVNVAGGERERQRANLEKMKRQMMEGKNAGSISG